MKKIFSCLVLMFVFTLGIFADGVIDCPSKTGAPPPPPPAGLSAEPTVQNPDFIYGVDDETADFWFILFDSVIFRS